MCCQEAWKCLGTPDALHPNFVVKLKMIAAACNTLTHPPSDKKLGPGRRGRGTARR